MINPQRRGIGGSDIAAICGLNSRRSAFDVWATIRGEMPVAPPSDRMWAGKKLERAIAEMYGERNNSAVQWYDRTRTGHDRDWQLWTPDFFVYPDYVYGADHAPAQPDGTPESILEAEDVILGGDAKNVAWDQQWLWGEEGTDQVPDRIACQCHWYISASGLPEWHVASLFGGNDFRIYIVKHDSEVEGILVQEGEKFWTDCILGGKMPDIKATEGAARYLKARFPNHSGKLRAPTGEEAALLEEYRLARKEARAAQAECDDLETRVKLAIGEDDGFQIGGERITYRKIKDTVGIDWAKFAGVIYEAFKAERPEVMDFMKWALGFRSVTREGYRRMDCRPKGEW